MLITTDLAALKRSIQQLIGAEAARLEELRREVRALRDRLRPIRPRSATTVSLVAADGGENAFEFDPFLVYVTRVVDSYGKVLFQDALSPLTDVAALSQRHLVEGTALGRLMTDLGVATLWELSPMIPKPGTPPDAIPPGWVKVYRDLGEWAALYDYLTSATFPSHTLVIRDGLLRSKIFADHLFPEMWRRIGEALGRVRQAERRKVYVVGVAKHSQVLDRYHLALFLEGVLVQPGACCLEVPAYIERQVYRWAEFARAEDGAMDASRRFVQGVLFLAKFGPGPFDPIWPVDVWQAHVEQGEVEELFGYLLADALAGFPRPYYPLCLQKAHEGASLSGFDLEVIRGLVLQAVREAMPAGQQAAPDAFRLFAQRREPFGY